jgi:hypothetical protein
VKTIKNSKGLLKIMGRFNSKRYIKKILGQNIENISRKIILIEDDKPYQGRA